MSSQIAPTDNLMGVRIPLANCSDGQFDGCLNSPDRTPRPDRRRQRTRGMEVRPAGLRSATSTARDLLHPDRRGNRHPAATRFHRAWAWHAASDREHAGAKGLGLGSRRSDQGGKEAVGRNNPGSSAADEVPGMRDTGVRAQEGIRLAYFFRRSFPCE
jgi:hypothetical protein